ncbi:MAG: glutathione peroxidase [Propionibacteriaceae bacterium]|jgi:glutathione peroxidase|nr:glutathione peroxidase [Propionibacteriaceae bacterium]
MTGFYDFVVKDARGGDNPLSSYEGKVVLVVNTATGCGFTPQYAGLEELFEKYHDRGFEILDFPCDQFGHQAPGSNEEIVSFCTTTYGTTFPQMAKIEVNGRDENPVYTFLKRRQGGMLGGVIKWNFTKFLIDRSGHVVDRFAPTTTPEAIETRIVALLG